MFLYDQAENAHKALAARPPIPNRERKIKMTPELLASILASLLSLLMSYAPGFETWYGGLSQAAKKLTMLGLLALIAAASYGLACTGWGAAVGLNLTCDADGLVTLLTSFLAALAANQTTYMITAHGRAEG